jgi:hypothetical protein
MELFWEDLMLYQLNRQGQLTPFDQNLVEYLYADYLPDTSLLILLNDMIPQDQSPNDPLLIAHDAATNPVDIDQLLQKIKSTSKHYILSGLYKYYKNSHQDPRVKFFPFWTLWMSQPYGPVASISNHVFSNKPKKYKVSCLNGTQWNHRILTYLALKKRAYFNDIVFTFGHRPPCQDIVNKITLTQFEQAEFAKLDHTVEFISADDQGIDLSVVHPAFQESYVNLVTETTVNPNTPMLSEKTFKPIIAGQLFVLIASPGAVQFLRDIGIDVFDDIIDHSYDQIVDFRVRLSQALTQIDQLVQLDLESIYTKIKPRLIKNSEYFLSQGFRDQFKLNFG